LRTHYANQLAAKRWIGNAGEAIAYDRVRWWEPYIALPTNLEELGAVIERAQGFPRIAAFRGAVRLTSLGKEKINRISRTDRSEEPDLEDAPLHWLMVDLDSKPEPQHFAWLQDPARAALWAAETYLPSEWKGIRFYYQYSGSAGIKHGLRIHFWYWLEEPLTSAELKHIFADRYGRNVFDLAVFQPSQPNYTAAPVFVHRSDPLRGFRSGFAGGRQ